MTTTTLAVTIAIIPSVLALLRLAQRDPKRLRLLGRRRDAAGTRERRALAALALGPGLVLAVCGLWPALLIWMGLLLAAGWCLAQGFAGAAPAVARKP
ncbi:MAG TPA: hypothetical protein VFM56_05890 [Solimonas sp.]|nr:hypothetical protein [Solimonas sp.]